MESYLIHEHMFMLYIKAAFCNAMFFTQVSRMPFMAYVDVNDIFMFFLLCHIYSQHAVNLFVASH